MNNLFTYTEEVESALLANKPIVALESTIISHGMPYPQNIETAIAVEEIIRQNDAIPATVAILNGKVHIGLDNSQLEYLGTNKNIEKASRRDMAFMLSQNLAASTTVSATMICAQKAGIKFFATGGIGGVHRGAENSFDVSADLTELGKTSMNVICAGAKSILDLPKTLEYLETQGVVVVGYQTDHFPAFYSAKSKLKIPMRIESPHELAHLIAYQRQLKLDGSILITNPIPIEYEIPNNTIEKMIETALSKNKLISGKAVTPYLLNELNLLSSGQTLAANIALIKNNARLAAEISVAYSNIFDLNNT